MGVCNFSKVSTKSSARTQSAKCIFEGIYSDAGTRLLGQKHNYISLVKRGIRQEQELGGMKVWFRCCRG